MKMEESFRIIKEKPVNIVVRVSEGVIRRKRGNIKISIFPLFCVSKGLENILL